MYVKSESLRSYLLDESLRSSSFGMNLAICWAMSDFSTSPVSA